MIRRKEGRPRRNKEKRKKGKRVSSSKETKPDKHPAESDF